MTICLCHLFLNSLRDVNAVDTLSKPICIPEEQKSTKNVIICTRLPRKTKGASSGGSLVPCSTCASETPAPLPSLLTKGHSSSRHTIRYQGSTPRAGQDGHSENKGRKPNALRSAGGGVCTISLIAIKRGGKNEENKNTVVTL